MLAIQTYTGAAARPFLDEVATLRIAVFRAFPYCYAGSLDYERTYLQAFSEAPDSIVVLALDAGQVVGASTGLPLSHEPDAVTQPWREGGHDVATGFYLSESVLLPAYRGQGAGVRFFDERERWAAARGYTWTTFCAVVRAQDDPRRPSDYRDLAGFWRKRGYAPQAGYLARMHWQEVGATEESAHDLQFWWKDALAPRDHSQSMDGTPD